MSVKWLRRLKVGDQPFQTREETSKYTDLMQDGKGKAVHLRDGSEIGHYAPGRRTAVARPGFLRNYRPRLVRTGPYPSGGRIDRCRNVLDAGFVAGTGAAEVFDTVSAAVDVGWRPALLQSRAVDETGYVQPPRQTLVDVRGVNSGYHFNAQQTWRIAQGGAITNVV